MKDGAEVIHVAPVTTKIINLSFARGVFPTSWKSAKVTAIFKNSSQIDNCDNYGPITILPTVSKIIERAVHRQLYDHLSVNNLLRK